MEIQQVPVANMAGMVFALLVSVGLPCTLAVVAARKWKAKLSSLLAGIVAFLFAVLLLEQMLHVAVLGLLAPGIAQNLWLYALYGAVTAAVFEETARFVTMKFFMKRSLTPQNAFMYGIGHGGAESVFLVGFASFSNLSTAMVVNNGMLQQALDQVDPAMQQETLERVSNLWTLPASQFFMGGFERIPAIALQLALSMLIFIAVRYGAKRMILLALAFHFAVDFVTVLAANTLPLWVTELLVFVMAAAICAFVWVQFKKCGKDRQ